MAKAILLLSGGLDSTLAGGLLMEMGIELRGLNLVSPFCRCTPGNLGCSAAAKAADQLGIPVKIRSGGPEYLKIMEHPKFRRGSGMNACIDCRIHLFSHARREMEEWGADFIATGDVLDERPMSQRRKTMELIDREAGLEGYVLRPLSARLLPPTAPEREGLLDRERLRSMQGRRRIPQFEMAKELGLTEYLCPGGGCLLTDPEFSERFRDLLAYEPGFDVSDANLLKVGRHFRFDSGAKAVVGRNEEENRMLLDFLRPGDVLAEPSDAPGPTVLCRKSAPEDLEAAISLGALYARNGERIGFRIHRIAEGGAREPEDGLRRATPMTRDRAARLWVGTKRTRSILARGDGE